MKPISLEEKEFRLTIYRMERRAIIPIKWIVLFVSAVLWIWMLDRLPDPKVFALFVAYFLFNASETYFYYFSQISLRQIKPFALVSYLIDVTFVSLLIYFDLATTAFGSTSHPDFYVLYFLLVMRGFALFKTITETIFINFLISILFVLTVGLQRADFSFIFEGSNAISLILIWMVILMSWFIVMVITQQKHELMAVHERLMRADNLAQVGELAAGVAHEINNPIGVIAATSEYLKMKHPDDQEQNEELDAIYREAMRCKEIVQEMLMYANPKPSEAVEINLETINDEVLNFIFPRRKEDVEIVREYRDTGCIIQADSNLIKQALLNLYINARQSIPEGRDGKIITRLYRKGSRVFLEVEDNGCGIPETVIQQIFDPFFTAKEGGTGLGLAVTQRVVEQCEGEISVRSEENVGSVFTLTFPLFKVKS